MRNSRYYLANDRVIRACLHAHGHNGTSGLRPHNNATKVTEFVLRGQDQDLLSELFRYCSVQNNTDAWDGPPGIRSFFVPLECCWSSLQTHSKLSDTLASPKTPDKCASQGQSCAVAATLLRVRKSCHSPFELCSQANKWQLRAAITCVHRDQFIKWAIGPDIFWTGSDQKGTIPLD